MEDLKPYSSSVEPAPHFIRHRSVPDVPEDVDFIMEHLNDPNYDIKGALASGDMELAETKKMKYAHSDVDTDSHFDSDRFSTSRAESRNSTAIEFDDESPYPEVRAAVASVDDPSMPVNTFRMWFIGVLFSILVSGLNQVLSMRYPGLFITGIVVQLFTLPLGKGLAWILPRKQFKTFGYTWSLNPGPFNIKEHVCITVMANVSVAGAYATEVIATQRIFYNQQMTYAYQILLAVGTQVLGFSLGGLLRPFVVWPSSMIWPGALVNAALFNTLHKSYGKSEGGHMSRMRFFCIAFACSFFWYFFPGFIFTALSIFNWACWIAPNNVKVNLLFGSVSGLGMGLFTFDWTMIAFFGSPLVTPWWSQFNAMFALVLLFWVITPAIYFTNTFFTAYLPISSTMSFDNTGSIYDPSAIITNSIFDLDKYLNYSPVFISAAFCVGYGVSFASFTSVIVHTFIWFHKDIMRRFRSSLKDERDVHSRLMQAYPEVPHYWYAIIGVIAFVFTVIAIHLFPTQLPIWAVVIAFLLAGLLSMPLAMLQAITNQQVPIQVIMELIAGYMVPGRPVANMVFKTTSYISINQAVGFAGDLKLGHYMKIPPRIMFLVQVAASVLASITTVSVQDWMLSNVEDICTANQKNGFSCPGTNTFATASLIWGGIGPSRLFSPGKIYNPLMWFFFIGAVLPIPFYILARRYPLSFWRFVNVPVFFAGVSGIPIGSGLNYASWGIVGFLFNYVIRRFHFRWWMRYNYILSAALDAGVAVSLVFIFLCLQFPKGGLSINWWGNTVWQNTADANGTSLLMTDAQNPTFGPTTW